MITTITSLHNDKVKQIRALQSAGKTRRTEKRIVLEGARLIGDALDSGAIPFYALYGGEAVETPAGAALLERLKSQAVECVEAAPDVMAHAADTQTPQGWLAVFPLPALIPPSAPTLALILDGVADPGNLGTILRTAAAASVDLVILAPGCVDAFNPKSLRGGMGAHFRIPLRRIGWKTILDEYGALPMYLAEADATTPYTAVDWRAPCAVIIGGEAHGADSAAQGAAAQQFTIPMASGAESLNAAAAAAVILFEVRRQRAG